jgi:RHS repeat-associated protein
LSGIEQKNGSGVIANDIYDLDDLNRLQAQTKDGNARAIVYDNTDQVKTVTGSNSEAYTYDLNGNRTGGGYVTIAGNRLMSDGTYSYEYDAEGNRTKRTKIADNTVDEYRWDYRNRLTQIVSKNAGGSVVKTVGYDYDVDDQRVKKTVTSATPSAGDGVENYYLDRNQIAFVTDGSGNQTFHYLYGLNVDAVMAQDSSAGMVWALADRLGSIETLTDKDGNVVNKRNFDSFGRILSETNPSVSFRYGYTGRERDLESGLDYYRARYYDPQVGRFISVDPMGFEAGDTNLYRYVGNNSTNATDPSGELIQIGGAALAGGIFGGLYALANDIETNKFGWDTIGNVARGAAIGAATAAVFASGIGFVATAFGAATATTLGTAATLTFTGLGVVSAKNNFDNNRPLTGFLDLVGIGLGAKNLFPPGGSNGLQLATAGGRGGAAISTGVSELLAGQAGGAIGTKTDRLFQDFFAAITNNDDRPQSSGGSGSGDAGTDYYGKNQEKFDSQSAGTYHDAPRKLTLSESFSQALVVLSRPLVSKVKGANALPGRQPGHFDKHEAPKEEIAAIINNPTRTFIGINKNSRQVNVFWKDGQVVITQDNDVSRVITAYGDKWVTKVRGGKEVPGDYVPAETWSNNSHYTEITGSAKPLYPKPRILGN